MTANSNDIHFMNRAITLAKKGSGRVHPNPLVGAVITRDDEVIAEGYHEFFGGPHAEINAIQNAGGSVMNCTLYVTLEPCNHYGKTPPCTAEIIRQGFKRVVFATTDPNPRVKGKGAQTLADQGIEVVAGIGENEAMKMNEAYFRFITSDIPFVTLKTAISLDGKIEHPDAKGFLISNKKSHLEVQKLRKQNMAVMVGVSTVLSDDPLLTIRPLPSGFTQPLRVILDSRGRTPADSNVLKPAGLFTSLFYITEYASPGFIKMVEDSGNKVVVSPSTGIRVDPEFVISNLGKRNISSVLVEGGGELNRSLIHAGIPDKLILFMNARIIGGSSVKTLVTGEPFADTQNLPVFRFSRIKKLHGDLMIEAYFEK